MPCFLQCAWHSSLDGPFLELLCLHWYVGIESIVLLPYSIHTNSKIAAGVWVCRYFISVLNYRFDFDLIKWNGNLPAHVCEFGNQALYDGRISKK